MGPEAAVLSERMAEMRRWGGYAEDLPLQAVPMYAEAAARARLEGPTYRFGMWARLRAAFHGRGIPVRGSGAAWTVAAAPIVTKDEGVGKGSVFSKEAPLATLPLRCAGDD